MPGRPRGEETRRHILSAAVDAFSLFGYDATGVAEICSSAGISKGAFYHHFPSKLELYLTLLEDWLVNIDTRLLEIKSKVKSVPETLLAMTSLFSEIFSSSKKKVPIFLEFLTRAGRDPVMKDTALRPYLRYRTYFSDLLRQGIEEGSVKIEDPDAAAQILVSLAVGLILQGILDGNTKSWGMTAEETLKLFIHGFIMK